MSYNINISERFVLTLGSASCGREWKNSKVSTYKRHLHQLLEVLSGFVKVREGFYFQDASEV